MTARAAAEGDSRWSGSSVPTAQPSSPPCHDVTPVCAPELPPSFREWAIGQRPTLDAYGELSVITPGGSSRGIHSWAMLAWLLASACVILLIIDPPSIGRLGWLAAGVASAIAAGLIQHRYRSHDLRLCRSKVIFPDSLDAPCRALLGRAQQAISIILNSDVRAAGLLGNPVPDEVLSQHEWEIASKLREITKLRSLHARNAHTTQAGPMTADVLTAHQRAVELAQQAASARVAALERYAEQITAADEANHDWQQALKLSELNEKYLDLVAGTASDEHAAHEITRLTGQLTATAEARRDRLSQADLAADVLVLSAPSTPIPRQADPSPGQADR